MLRLHPEAIATDVPRPLVRTLTIIAICLVAVLNIGDVITTHLVIARQGVEANPLAGALLSNGALLWVKLGLVALAALGAVRNPPRVGVLLLSWFVAGVYATAVLSNALLLRLT